MCYSFLSCGGGGGGVVALIISETFLFHVIFFCLRSLSAIQTVIRLKKKSPSSTDRLAGLVYHLEGDALHVKIKIIRAFNSDINNYSQPTVFQSSHEYMPANFPNGCASGYPLIFPGHPKHNHGGKG